MSHTQQFVDLSARLRHEAGWFGPDAMTRAIQAVVLVLSDRPELAEHLPGAMRDLHSELGWFTNLRGTLGQSLVALALVKGIDPAALPARVQQVSSQFRSHGIPRMGLWPTAAAGWLALESDADIQRAVPRMAQILAEWKKDHPWITGHDDLHAAALHALRTASPAEIRTRVEDRMVALEDIVFSFEPNNRQRVAQLAALRPSVEAPVLAERYNQLSAALKARGRAVSMTDREALVLLATAPGTVPELARAYDASRSALKAMDGGFWLGGNIRGIVAAGLVAADHGQDASDAITGATLSAIIVAIQTAVLVGTAVAVT